MSMESGMPPKLGEPKPPREGNWFIRLPTWAKWTIGVVAALLLLGAGAAIGSGEEDELKDDIAALEAEGLLAVCIQHELDHLDGKVFVEYLSQLKQGRIKSKLAKRARITA